jgi:hypothetical protein
MIANLVRWALVAALCPLFLSAAPPPPLVPPPPWDIMAWETFAIMVTPANGPGVKAVAFETWADESDIYTPPAPRWPGAGGKLLHRGLAAQALTGGAPHPMLGVAAPGSCNMPPDGAAGNFPKDACIGEEVRHNRAVFDTVNSRHLYTTQGLIEAYASGKPTDFPSGAVVVKADWIKVSDILRWLPTAYHSADDVRRAYYTNSATLNGQKTEFALAGMSVQAKRAPHWLWMTFEHRSNLGRCDKIGCHDNYGAAVPNVAPRATPNTDYGPCVKSRGALLQLARAHADAVWENYCLKGTQTDYVKPDGSATVLANSVIERMNKGVAVDHTSCITCHTYASFDSGGHPNYAALGPRPIGAVQPEVLKGYRQNDALWSFLAIPQK